jgi:hypothetical protein
LYAIWEEFNEPLIYTYQAKVIFYANGGDANDLPEPAYGEDITDAPVSGKTVSIKIPFYFPERDGYEFKGWSLNSLATSADYLPNISYDFPASATTCLEHKLYAIWEESGDPALDDKNADHTWLDGGDYKVTLNFDLNGSTESYYTSIWGTSNVLYKDVYGGTSSGGVVGLTLPEAPTRTGYTFLYWYLKNSSGNGYVNSTDPSLPGVEISPLSTYSIETLATDSPKEYYAGTKSRWYSTGNTSYTLVAQWKQGSSSGSGWSGVSIYNSTTGKWENYDVYIYDPNANSGLGDWVKYDVYIYNGTWKKMGS